MISENEINDMIKMFKFRYNIGKSVMLKHSKLNQINGNTVYVKYTPKSNMYNILDSDSLYLFCSELSNDRSENHIIPIKNTIDTYITCFYQSVAGTELFDSNDIYSQWMSYCRDGGASLEFYFGQDLIGINPDNMGEDECQEKVLKAVDEHKDLFSYSILCSNAKKESDFIKYSTFPFQVHYFDESVAGVNWGNGIYPALLEGIIDNVRISEEQVAPYFKHSGFIQESAARLAVLNKDNQLSSCINFMDKKDGTKIPYIVVKFGDMDANERPCDFVDNIKRKDMRRAIENKIDKIPPYKFNNKSTIIIPQGRDQEEVYNMVEAAIKERQKKENKLDDRLPNIICKGHLPITRITLAPTEDRAEQRKQMEIYCKSKYWLRNVKVCESVIPYNTHNSNHI